MFEPVSITACYVFCPLAEDQLETLREEIVAFGQSRGMKGLILIATEGINATVCGSSEAIGDWKEYLKKLHEEIIFKDSSADREIFRKWSVKIKPEIVTIKQLDIQPGVSHRHLSPEEWNDVLSKEDVILLDARNKYEVSIGKFRGAIDPKIESFHEFPEFVRRTNLPKEKKVLLYCTGGIRCEKAIVAMEKEGFENVYQLQGGILAYLEKFPGEKFEGECFVFDERVAVDQELRPSQKFQLCADCGDPSPIDAQEKHCALTR